MAKQSETTPVKSEVEKMLGGLVPSNVYWKFKEVASRRKENMAEAIMHAALMYIDAESFATEEEI